MDFLYFKDKYNLSKMSIVADTDFTSQKNSEAEGQTCHEVNELCVISLQKKILLNKKLYKGML